MPEQSEDPRSLPQVINKDSFGQASSMSKDGEVAKGARSPEEASRRAWCGSDTNSCLKGGDTAPSVTMKGTARGSARVGADVRTAMRDTKHGKKLLETEDKARAAEAAARKELDEIERRLTAALSSDRQELATKRVTAYQDWSNKNAELNKAMGDVEEEARSHYGIDFSEQPIAVAGDLAGPSLPGTKSDAQSKSAKQ